MVKGEYGFVDQLVIGHMEKKINWQGAESTAALPY